MTTPQVDKSSRGLLLAGLVYSSVVLAIGLTVSILTGEWIALLCATGLVIIPVGGAAFAQRRKSNSV